MQRQSSTLGRKLTIVLSVMAFLKILIVLAGILHGAYWAFLVLGCAGSLSILVLMASASLQVRADEPMLQGSRRLAEASQAVMLEETGVLLGNANRNSEEMAVPMKEVIVSSEGTAKTLAIIHEIAFQTNILALHAALQGVRSGEGTATEEIGSRTFQPAQSIADSDASARLDAVVESVRRLTSPNITGAEHSAAAGDEAESHSQSLWSLVSEVRSLSGASAAPAPTLPAEAEAVNKPVGVFASMPGCTGSRRDENEAAN
jgi:methyl-accepting chemotaxis protein